VCDDEWTAVSNALPNKWLEPTGARVNFLRGTDGGVAALRRTSLDENYKLVPLQLKYREFG
jgi:hypothetical protein